jgi:hypothetical protein
MFLQQFCFLFPCQSRKQNCCKIRYADPETSVPQIDKSGKVRLGRRYISLWKTQDKKRVAGLAVFEVIDGVFQGVTSFVPTTLGEPNLPYAERQRKGLLLYGKGR